MTSPEVVDNERRKCAYCGNPGDLTREHIIPKFIFDRAAGIPQERTVTNVRTPSGDKSIWGEPTISDVCGSCNNTVLSELDGYAATLYDEYFSFTPQIGRELYFRFDYAKLLRWLLKLAYNTARSREWKGRLFDLLKDSVPFIRGLRADLDAWTTLHVLSPLSDSLIERSHISLERGRSPQLDLRRIARLSWKSCEGFQIGMNHYQFRVFLGVPNLNRANRNAFRKEVLQLVPSSCHLTARSKTVKIYASKWTVLDEAARSNPLRRNVKNGAKLVKSTKR